MTEQLGREIGSLMPDLSDSILGAPIDPNYLATIIESPDRDLIVARLDERVVGSAVMNLILYTSGRKAWLEDFVVSSEKSVRGSGIGYAIWQEAVTWARERGASMEFTSAPTREQAHEFYFRQGAYIKPTSPFRYDT